MPELPEVETVVRGVRPYLVGRRIRAVEVLNPTVCAFGASELRGAVVREVDRRGKYILLHLTRRRGEPVLVFHLGMSGQLLLLLPQVQIDRHTHLVLRLTGLTDELRFRDVRRLGGVCLYRSATEIESEVLDRLGPEADTLTSTDLARVAWTSSRPIKPLLMDQGKVAGLGNIYTDESLWRARLHPLRPSVSLSADELRELARAIRTVLRQAIRYHGSTVDDFRAPDGSPRAVPGTPRRLRSPGAPLPPLWLAHRSHQAPGTGHSLLPALPTCAFRSYESHDRGKSCGLKGSGSTPLSCVGSTGSPWT